MTTPDNPELDTVQLDEDLLMIREANAVAGQIYGRARAAKAIADRAFVTAAHEELQWAGLCPGHEVRDEEFHTEPDAYAAVVAELERLDAVAVERIAARPSGDLTAWYFRGVCGAVRAMRIVAGLDGADESPFDEANRKLMGEYDPAQARLDERAAALWAGAGQDRFCQPCGDVFGPLHACFDEQPVVGPPSSDDPWATCPPLQPPAAPFVKVLQEPEVVPACSTAGCTNPADLPHATCTECGPF